MKGEEEDLEDGRKDGRDNQGKSPVPAWSFNSLNILTLTHSVLTDTLGALDSFHSYICH